MKRRHNGPIRLFLVLGAVIVAIHCYVELGSSQRIVKKDDELLTIPSDFGFRYEYGVNRRNILDTFEGIYTKDLKANGQKTIKFRFSAPELKLVYEAMLRNRIFKMPEELKPKVNVRPSREYKFTIQWNGQEKIVQARDIKKYHEAGEANALWNVVTIIDLILTSREEIKMLPPARGKYK